MKWVYSIKYKVQAALILTIIVFFVFAKNIVDRRNITEMGKDFVSFYDDRLVVESYIFEITEHLFLMKLSVNQPELESNMLEKDIEAHRTAIFNIIEDFENTNLTTDEASHLSQLKQKIHQLGNYMGQEEGGNVEEFNSDFEETFEDVRALSAIQLYEGGKLLEESGRIVNRSGVWTQLEMAVLVILLVVIYLLIFSSRSIRSKMKQNPSLN